MGDNEQSPSHENLKDNVINGDNFDSINNDNTVKQRENKSSISDDVKYGDKIEELDKNENNGNKTDVNNNIHEDEDANITDTKSDGGNIAENEHTQKDNEINMSLDYLTDKKHGDNEDDKDNENMGNQDEANILDNTNTVDKTDVENEIVSTNEQIESTNDNVSFLEGSQSHTDKNNDVSINQSESEKSIRSAITETDSHENDGENKDVTMVTDVNNNSNKYFSIDIEPKLNVDEENQNLEDPPSRKDSFDDIFVMKRDTSKQNEDDDVTLETELAQFTESLQSKPHAPSPVVALSDDDEEFDVGNENNVNKEAIKYESEFLTRRIMEGRENESYLKAQLAEKERDLENAQNKIKDLQLRLIRFTKDDQAKDKHVASLEKEIRDANRKIEEIVGNMSKEKEQPIHNNLTEKNESDAQAKSKACVIL